MLIETKVQQFRIDQTCDKCPDGEFYKTGQSANPEATPHITIYEHKCYKCGAIAWYDKQYPQVELRHYGKSKEVKA